MMCSLGEGSSVNGCAPREALGAEDLLLTIDLGIGEASATVWTTDLSYEYVRINSEV